MSKAKLAELKVKMEALAAELKANYKEGLREAAEEVFKSHPMLESFSWTQYTPYFNDGEPCEFGVYADYPEIKFMNKEEIDSHSLVYTEYGLTPQGGRDYRNVISKSIHPEYQDVVTVESLNEIEADVKAFAIEILYPFENTLQGLLGEGKIVVSRTGIETEEYDHD